MAFPIRVQVVRTAIKRRFVIKWKNRLIYHVENVCLPPMHTRIRTFLLCVANYQHREQYKSGCKYKYINILLYLQEKNSLDEEDFVMRDAILRLNHCDAALNEKSNETKRKYFIGILSYNRICDGAVCM